MSSLLPPPLDFSQAAWLWPLANVPIDARHFEYTDTNKNGQVDAGDMVVGRDGLYHKDGNEFGRLFAAVTIYETDGNGIATKWADTQVYALDGGGIFAFGAHNANFDVGKLAAAKFKGENVKASRLIIGGSGSYAGASGQIEYTFTDGNGTFDVNVTCR